MSNYYDEEVRKIQWQIDMIKDHAMNFFTRLNLAIIESVYMNFLNCPSPLTKLNDIISGNADVVLTPTVTINNTFETQESKGEELRSLRSEVVEIIYRLYNVMDRDVLHDLLSEKCEIDVQREEVYYWEVYNDVTMEKELDYPIDQFESTNFMDNSSDDSDDVYHEPICK